MKRIREIWAILGPKEFPIGIEKIRYNEKSTVDIYLGIKQPENFRMLSIRLAIENVKTSNLLSGFKGIRIDKVIDSSNERKAYINLLLIDNVFTDIFDSFLYDMVENLIICVNETDVIKEFTNRIFKWKLLFEKAELEGLTFEAQQGLYGEVFFIRKWVSTTNNLSRCIKAWVGPGQSVRDFQMEDWALEVKTTHGNNHQRVSVSSERQLDTSTLSNVYLFHLSLDVQQSSGETLVEMIDAVKVGLQNDLPALADFNFKLLEAGYYNQHQHLYTDKGYHIRQENVYNVKGNFPRIEESELREGVGDVKYSIILSTCAEYLISENQVFDVLNQTING